MSTAKKRPPLASRMVKSLGEGIAFAKEEQELVRTVVPIGRTYAAEEVIAIRTKRQLSQIQFAKLLAVSVKTLQSWEQGVRIPSKPTMRLLQIFDDPDSFRPILLPRVVREPREKS
jgi:putative transcriptional regulator